MLLNLLQLRSAPTHDLRLEVLLAGIPGLQQAQQMGRQAVAREVVVDQRK